MNIFITGGTGFLGQKLIKQLKSKKHSVLALSRSENSNKVLKKLGATVIEGDLNNIQNWGSRLLGVDVVIHAGSPIDLWGKWNKFYEEIVLATKNLYLVSIEKKVKKFIYISSESVLQDKEPLLDINETYPYPNEPNSFYGKSKMMAEKELTSIKSKTKLLIFRPTFIWGKENKQFDEIFKKVKSGEFLWVNQGNAIMEMVHVDNVVHAILLGINKGEGIYFVTDDEPKTVREFFSPIFTKRNVPIPKLSLPSFILYPIAYIVEFIWKFFRLTSVPSISRFQLDFVSLPRRYNLDKIKKELKFKPVTSFKKGLNEFQF